MKNEILFSGKLLKDGEFVKGDLIHWNESMFIVPQEKPCGDETFSDLLDNYEVDPESVSYASVNELIQKPLIAENYYPFINTEDEAQHFFHYTDFNVWKEGFEAAVEAFNPLVESLTDLVELHMCEQEGLASGRPTPTQWLLAVDKAIGCINGMSDKKIGQPVDIIPETIKELFSLPFDNRTFLTDWINKNSGVTIVSITVNTYGAFIVFYYLNS